MLDVIVIGGGPAGLLVADQLKSAGQEVELVEAGARDQANGKAQPAGDPAWRYRALGSECWWPRALAMGGRSHLWGGWLSRFSPETFREGCWPYTADELEPYYAAAERWLGATTDPLAPRYRRAARALGVAVRPRTIARGLIGKNLETRIRGLEVRAHVNTVALGLESNAEGCRVHVVCGSKRQTLRARAVVLAASPLETARLLLASGVRHPWVGRRLTDHFNLSYLLLEPGRKRGRAAAAPEAAFIPRFVNRGPATRRSYRGGYAIEIIGPLAIDRLDEGVRALCGAELSPDASFTYVNALGEQWRHRARFVDLAPRARDALGRRLPRIHFAWSAAERRLVADMKASCREVARAIGAPGATLVRYRDPFIMPPVFHPAGTCAMGTDARAPCDPWGRLRPLPQVWVADASVFPSGGDCHPTLTVLAHALRVAESIERALG
jgi:choline dehydrogenase-like flavoprotein